MQSEREAKLEQALTDLIAATKEAIAQIPPGQPGSGSGPAALSLQGAVQQAEAVLQDKAADAKAEAQAEPKAD